ncbi:MAG: hypothetical protein PHQ34_01155 [Methanothrix sp.]|nr:hypothetical protein [Methanothrix sp.]
MLGDKIACPRGGKSLRDLKDRAFLLVLRFLSRNSLQPELKIAFGADVRLKRLVALSTGEKIDYLHYFIHHYLSKHS